MPARLGAPGADMWLLFSAADVVRGRRRGVRNQLWEHGHHDGVSWWLIEPKPDV